MVFCTHESPCGSGRAVRQQCRRDLSQQGLIVQLTYGCLRNFVGVRTGHGKEWILHGDVLDFATCPVACAWDSFTQMVCLAVWQISVAVERSSMLFRGPMGDREWVTATVDQSVQTAPCSRRCSLQSVRSRACRYS